MPDMRQVTTFHVGEPFTLLGRPCIIREIEEGPQEVLISFYWEDTGQSDYVRLAVNAFLEPGYPE